MFAFHSHVPLFPETTWWEFRKEDERCESSFYSPPSRRRGRMSGFSPSRPGFYRSFSSRLERYESERVRNNSLLLTNIVCTWRSHTVHQKKAHKPFKFFLCVSPVLLNALSKDIYNGHLFSLLLLSFHPPAMFIIFENDLQSSYTTRFRPLSSVGKTNKPCWTN